MPVIALKSCPEFTAGDHCLLREMIHPDKQDLALRYSLAHATVPAGKTTTPHRLCTSEVYYILQGQGLMHIDDDHSEVAVSDTVYIPPHAVQSITNTGPGELTFICIVDPAWQDENEEILG
ncbi:MAG: cupin domain-containing protein [Phycisphaerae bacterium]|nr:cupin domain-containing protein [Phycisphaerae bacterium]